MSEWTATTLGDLCREGGGGIQTGPFGSQLHASDYVLTGVPSVMPQNIGDNVINEDGIARIQESDAQRLSKYRMRKGDIVYSRRGDVEKRALVREANDGWLCGTGCLRVRLGKDSTHDPAFLSYLLGTEESREWIVRHAVGATMPNLNTSILSSFPLAVPEPAAQRAIAGVLGALDDKIAANTTRASKSMELAGLLYDREASKLSTRPMSEVLTPVLGGTPTRSKAGEFWGGRRLWASAKDITGANFGVVVDTAEKITDLAVETTKARPLPRGSVVLTARGTVGAVARLAVPSSFNQSCYGFIPGIVPAGVLYFAVLRATQRAKEIAHGSVFDTITMKTFDHLAIPDFDSTEISAIEAVVGPLLELVSAAVVENSALAQLRDSLLPQLMSGKLRVKDAEKVLEDAGV